MLDAEIGILAWYPTDRLGLAAAAPLERAPALEATLRELARNLGSAAGPADAADVAERAMTGLVALAVPSDRFTLEVGVDPDGPFATAAIVGEGTLAADLETCVGLGMARAIASEIEARFSRIARAERDERRISVTVHAGRAPACEVAIARALRPGDRSMPADEPLSRVLAIAGELGASAAQQRLVPRVHAILAGEHLVFARLGATLAGAAGTPALLERVVLEYADATTETGLKVATGLGGDDAAVRFGKFTGALDADRVLAIELHLGRVDPMPARIACPVSARIGAMPS